MVLLSANGPPNPEGVGGSTSWANLGNGTKMRNLLLPAVDGTRLAQVARMELMSSRLNRSAALGGMAARGVLGGSDHAASPHKAHNSYLDKLRFGANKSFAVTQVQSHARTETHRDRIKEVDAASVVTEVISEEAKVELALWRQGDLDLQSDAALQRRMALRRSESAQTPRNRLTHAAHSSTVPES